MTSDLGTEDIQCLNLGLRSLIGGVANENLADPNYPVLICSSSPGIIVCSFSHNSLPLETLLTLTTLPA